MKINGNAILGKEFAYDGTHKIYIIEDSKDKEDALSCDYTIYPIKELENTYNGVGELKFINNWKLNKTYVSQFEYEEYEIVFEY